MSNKQVFSSPANVVFASRTPARVIPPHSRHAFAKPHRRASRNIYTVSAVSFSRNTLIDKHDDTSHHVMLVIDCTAGKQDELLYTCMLRACRT